ncbi:hypothetical protein GLAREA_03925 [Glarea lozoyensis ATCC 20868]|uniref:Uncharacterized protein n=1 Tax=Glarea lozoyensis (strain ATCC 20868 / MF5171) TaxID=1116229 RepID=S3DX45_GLAL2|nr:uncharacterized protein GLAREA_03925 [Glarea lozoyensis ATCC 20868]EPE30958.1 hypothetical protein GLAREA_03925 [Glarea lozoyensis ATCC 20868]
MTTETLPNISSLILSPTHPSPTYPIARPPRLRGEARWTALCARRWNLHVAQHPFPIRPTPLSPTEGYALDHVLTLISLHYTYLHESGTRDFSDAEVKERLNDLITMCFESFYIRAQLEEAGVAERDERGEVREVYEWLEWLDGELGNGPHMMLFFGEK